MRYVNSGLEEGEVNKSVLESVGKFDRKLPARHFLGVDQRYKLKTE